MNLIEVAEKLALTRERKQHIAYRLMTQILNSIIQLQNQGIEPKVVYLHPMLIRVMADIGNYTAYGDHAHVTYYPSAMHLLLESRHPNPPHHYRLIAEISEAFDPNQALVQ